MVAALGAAIFGMYVVQSSLSGLAENTLPRLLNRDSATLYASQILAIVKLPAALKIFAAPFMDFLGPRMPGNFKGLVVVLQGMACISLFLLAPMMDFAESPHRPDLAADLRWPLFWAAVLVAMGDLVLDAYAAGQFPEESSHLPALCQVSGILAGKTGAKSLFFLLQARSLLDLPGFVQMLASLTLACIGSVLAFGGHDIGSAQDQGAFIKGHVGVYHNAAEYVSLVTIPAHSAGNVPPWGYGPAKSL